MWQRTTFAVILLLQLQLLGSMAKLLLVETADKQQRSPAAGGRDYAYGDPNHIAVDRWRESEEITKQPIEDPVEDFSSEKMEEGPSTKKIELSNVFHKHVDPAEEEPTTKEMEPPEMYYDSH